MFEKMRSEQEQIVQEIKRIEDELADLPDGKLICAKTGIYTKWYRSYGHRPIYLPKKEKALAEKLALKKYLETKREELEIRKQAIDDCLKAYAEHKVHTEDLLMGSSPYAELLQPYFQSKNSGLAAWMHASYEKNPHYPERCIYKTSAGFTVRSKSEALIAMLLHVNRIPFRYECKLELGDMTIYPDFTIRHPQTDKLYYWEHFGLMDQPAYTRKTFRKLQLYTASDIIPMVNLITTYETQEHPLDIRLVENLIHNYFL